MKKHFLFAALFLAALVLGFAGCENPDDGIDNDVKYKLYAISNNSIMGTVVGSGAYKKGTEVTITAKPNDLYHLCTWSDVDTKDLVRKIVVNSDTVITAIFSDNPYLRVKSNNTSYGTVTGSGIYEIGSEVTITANPKAKHRFLSWSDCDSKELTRVVVVNTDSTIVANFAKNPYLTAKPNDAKYGTVTGSGYYEVGTKVTITAATKGENFYFKGWSDCDSKELTREVVITSDTTIMAIFTADPYLNVKSNNTSLGTVTDCSGYYKSGTKVTITATPEENYYFTSWSDGNTKNPRTVVVNSDTTFTANFVLKPYLTVASNYGMVTGSGYYMPGEEVTITATPNSGAYFVEWNDGNTDNPRTIIVNEDITYTATFAGNPNGTANGYEWVDLGLPSGIKWATCNVGATEPKKYGNYYAWGVTETKATYTWNTYTWATAKYTYDVGYGPRWDLETLTKYNTEDNKTQLELEDDAARANWGGSWRMPTDGEWAELVDECTWEWKNAYKGTTAGYLVTSKINGNSIFLPAAGYRYYGNLDYAGNYGEYWSSSLHKAGSSYALGVCLSSDYVSRGCYGSRYYGKSVRPVLGE